MKISCARVRILGLKAKFCIHSSSLELSKYVPEPGGLWMGAGHQKVQAVLRNLELSTLLPVLQRGTGNGVMLNHAYMTHR